MFCETFALLQHSVLRKILSKKQQQEWSQSAPTQAGVCEQRTGALSISEKELQHLRRPKAVRDRDMNMYGLLSVSMMAGTRTNEFNFYMRKLPVRHMGNFNGKVKKLSNILSGNVIKSSK